MKTRVYTLYVHPKVIKLLGFDTHVLVHIVNMSITNFLLTWNQFWTCLSLSHLYVKLWFAIIIFTTSHTNYPC